MENNLLQRISMQQERIVVTKDRDFLDSFLLRQQPYKLLLVTTGNITKLIGRFFGHHWRF
jgi:predicted nuclease of predicted toxin-antitoxin system